MNRKIAFSVILFILVLGWVQQAWTTVSSEEKAALVALYTHTDGGSSWIIISGWVDHATTDPCGDDWYGITCNATNDSVTKLQLESNNLSGTIPPELGNLSQLTRLFLSGNSLSGSIPKELGNLSQLETIGLYNNPIDGPIPPELGNLSQLTQFSLFGNDLSGAIPRELGNLNQLESLHLQNNQLCGAVPSTLSNLTLLTEGTGLDLNFNSLLTTVGQTLDDFITLKSGSSEWKTNQGTVEFCETATSLFPWTIFIPAITGTVTN